MSFTPRGKPDAADFYDSLPANGDSLHFKKRKGAEHRTGLDIDMVMPEGGEVRLIGNRHKQC